MTNQFVSFDSKIVQQLATKAAVPGSPAKRTREANGKKGKEDEPLSKKKKPEVATPAAKSAPKVVSHVSGLVFLCLFDAAIFSLMLVWN